MFTHTAAKKAAAAMAKQMIKFLRRFSFEPSKNCIHVVLNVIGLDAYITENLLQYFVIWLRGGGF
jgi:hypothetical protein